MVHVPTRVADEREVPVRLGPSVQNVPDYGPSKISRAPYTDPMQFELERERVLNTSWLLAGRSAQLAGTGDWLSLESHGETIVIVRQPEGHLAAFHNVCMHRGAAFVTEWKGCAASEFKCPYHGWSYDLTGKVKGVPERTDFDPEHLKGLRSPQVAVDEWGGWVWVNLDGPDAAPSLRSWIGTEIIADLGQYEMDEMVLLDVLEWDVPVSYKAVVDGFNEIYHTAELHQSAGTGRSRPATPAFGSSTITTTCASSPVISIGPSSSRSGTTTSGRSATTSCSPTPCSTATRSTSRCSTRSPSKSTARGSCAGRSSTPATSTTPSIRSTAGACRPTGITSRTSSAEDIAIYEHLARTKRSSAYRENILNARECKIAHYHETMARLIQG